MKTHITISGSDVLYHSTYISNAISILQDKKFILAPAVLYDEAKHGANWFFLSTARTILTKFLTNRAYVIFELDGRKLGQKYRIRPVNYHKDSAKREAEDRVFSTVPYIPLDYITSIHVPLNYDPTPTSDYTTDTYIQTIKRLGKKLGIPVYFYNTTFLRNLSPKNRVHVPLAPLSEDKQPRVGNRGKSIQAFLQMVLASPMSKVFETPLVKHQIERLQEGINIIYDVFSGNKVSKQPLGPQVLRKLRRLDFSMYDILFYLNAKVRMRNGVSVVSDCLSILEGHPAPQYLTGLEHDELKQFLYPETIIIKEYGLDDTEYTKLMKYGNLETVIDKIVNLYGDW